jgi:hypothetical protein
MRPSAPQNNYKVTATGGSGNGGKVPAQYAAGIDNAQDFYDMQTAAPMGDTPTVPSPSSSRGAQAPTTQKLTPLDAPTDRPNEPLTTGMPFGAGAGPEVMHATDQTAQTEDMKRLRQALPALAVIADLPTSSNAFRNYVTYLRGVL